MLETMERLWDHHALVAERLQAAHAQASLHRTASSAHSAQRSAQPAPRHLWQSLRRRLGLGATHPGAPAARPV